MDFLDPIVKRYRSRFVLFWLRSDAAFAQPQVYEYCEGERVTYFIRLPANAVLNRLIDPYLTRPVGRPPKVGIQVKLVDLRYQAQTWDRERRVVAKIEWHDGELFPRIGFIVTNSRLTAGKVIKVYNGRGDVENRVKEGKNTLRWDKTSCRRFSANQARLLMGVLAYNLLHMLRQFYLVGEEIKRSMEWLIKRLIKVGAKVGWDSARTPFGVSGASLLPLKGAKRSRMAGPPHNSGLCTPIHQKQCLIKEGPGSLEGSAGIQKYRAMGQGSGVISLHGRFRAHGHTIRTALPACGMRFGLINGG